MKVGEYMSKTILSLLDKQAHSIRTFRHNMNVHYNSQLLKESDYDSEIKTYAEKLIGKKIHELRRISTNLSSERNEITLTILNLRESGKEVDADLTEQAELLAIKISILEKAISIKQEYQKHPTYLVERNLLDHPLFDATSPHEKSLQKLRTPEGIIEFDKKGFRRLLYVNGRGAVLTTYDLRVFIGLFKLWEIKGKSATFEFDFSELLECIYAEKTGGEYALVEKALNNLAATSIIMEEYFDPKTGKRTRTKTHNPIANSDVDSVMRMAKIEFNNTIQDNLLAGNSVQISMALFNDLASPSSKSLYVHLSNHIRDENYTFDIDELIQHIGLHSNERYKALLTIKEAFQELKEFGFISSFETINRGNTAKKLVYAPSEWALATLRTSEEGIQTYAALMNQ